MSEDDSRSSRFFSVPRMRPKPSMQSTHTYIEAHRFITPHSTRANTEPTGGIDSAIMGIISSRSPHSHRIHKLLRGKATSERKGKKTTAQAELFDRVYFRERKRVLTEMEEAQARKQQLRAKLGLTRKPSHCFYQFSRADLNYIEGKLPPHCHQGGYRQKLHPVCRLYEEYAHRVSQHPGCLENPFEERHS